MFKNLLLSILLVLPMTANAHSQLVSSSPKNGETLALSPTEIVMEFKSPAKLIKVDLIKPSDKQGKSLLGRLLRTFMERPESILSREQLLDKAW